ncbi:unnamed protein product [Calypogeia fissa]
MADQPARALIIYGDGLLRAVEPRHLRIHALADAGCCGFLALRTQPDQECNPSSDDDENRVVGELAQLLDLHDIYQKKAAARVGVTPDTTRADDEQVPSMSDRFMGMKACMYTNSGPAAALGKEAGFSLLELQEGNSVIDDHAPPDASTTAVRFLSLLGLLEGTADTEQMNFDLLLLHLSAKEHLCSKQVDWVDALLGALQASAQAGTKAGSHLYLIVVLGFGPVESSKDDGYPLVVSDERLAPKLVELFPQQSYKRKGGHPVEDVREHHPLLAAYQLDSVTRRDDVKMFGYDEFQKSSGNLTILVDRFLHEIAFKLWKSPKYGA